MNSISLAKALSASTYPGRGIVVGQTPDARFAVMAYFIMGRSENSRNRIFVRDGEGIRTQAFDPSKMTDPSLIIYAPVRVLGPDTIVTNGDQTDTVYEGLRKGLTFEQSLRSRTFEPDGPNYTPRISALVRVDGGRFGYAMSILKSCDGDPSGCIRSTFSFETPPAGEGRFIHTYRENAEPLPSFEGEPERVQIEGDIDSFTALVWDNLDNDNRVSLFVRFIEIGTGKTETRIINRHSSEEGEAR